MLRPLFTLLLLLLSATTLLAADDFTLMPADADAVEAHPTPDWQLFLPARADAPAPANAKAPAKAPGLKDTTIFDTTLGYGWVDAFGITSFKLHGPQERNTVLSSQRYMLAGTRIGEYFYLAEYDYPKGSNFPVVERLMRVKPGEGKWTTAATFAGGAPIMMDLTYSYPAKQIYGITAETGGWASHLVKIDLPSGKITVIADYDDRFFGIAADTEGKLYAIDRHGDLYNLNPSSGAKTFIGSSGVTALYMGSMDFDHKTHLLYYTSTLRDKVCHLYEINPNNAGATEMGTIGVGNNAKQVTSLNVQLNLPGGDTPSGVDSLTVTPGAKGATTATVSWINPTTTFAESPLTTLTKVELSVAGKVYQTWDNPTPGGKITATVNVGTTGNVAFRVQASNEAGAGDVREHSAWIGWDVPAAPQNVRIVKGQGTRATLTWDAPTTTVHGGYFDFSQLRYRIRRTGLNSGVTETPAKVWRGGTTFTDSTITTLDRYYYTINSLGRDLGDSVVSRQKVLGPALTTPYFCNFNTEAKWNLWTMADADGDGKCWVRYLQGGMIYILAHAIPVADDWAIAPPVHLQAGKRYFIYFDTYCNRGAFKTKRIEVNLGTDDQPVAQRIIKTIDFATPGTERQAIFFTVDKTGEYFVGIRDHSATGTWRMNLANFGIEEDNTATLTGTVTDATTGKPLAGARVAFEHSVYSIVDTTDAQGHYTIVGLRDEGAFNVSTTLYAYHDDNTAVTVTKGDTLTHNVALVPRESRTVGGVVKDDQGNLLRSAKVWLKGYSGNYLLTTDGQGRFSVPETIYDGRYYLRVERTRHMLLQDSVTIASDTTLAISLRVKANPVAAIQVAGQGSNAIVSWDNPLEVWRRDMGSYSTQDGSLRGTEKTIDGTTFYTPGTISRISWVTTDYQGPHTKVNLWILGLKDDGTPGSTVLWNKRGVVCGGDLRWNVYTLPTPVSCPNGFLVGVSQDSGMVSLALDNGTGAGWPMAPATTWEASDYTTGKWEQLDSYQKGSFLLRATGKEPAEDSLAYEQSYKVWRFSIADLNNTAAWVPLGTVSANQLTDDLSQLTDTTYFYAIQTVVPNGLTSPIAYSTAVKVKGGKLGAVSDVLADAASDVRIWPVPATTVVNVSAEFTDAALYDMSGRQVARAARARQISVEGLPTGLYTLRMAIGGSVVVRKVIVK